MKLQLDWASLSPGDFEKLSRELASQVYPHTQFSLHLGHGQKQDGIDIIGFDTETGKNFCIQNKRAQSFSPSDVKNAINEFIGNRYLEISSIFLLTVSCHLQSDEIQLLIHSSKAMLTEKHKINFDCWDQKKMESLLENHYRIVAKYFGKYAASRFCNPEIKRNNFVSVKAVNNYINRELYEFAAKQDGDIFRWHFNERKSYDLKKMLTETAAPNKIIVLADSYEGKSSYLRQVAVEIENYQQEVRFQPIFIEVKDNKAQPIDDILNNQCGDWQSIPLKSIVLFIDGLDEVEADKFNDLAYDIQTFCNNHSAVSKIKKSTKKEILYIVYQI